MGGGLSPLCTGSLASSDDFLCSCACSVKVDDLHIYRLYVLSQVLGLWEGDTTDKLSIKLRVILPLLSRILYPVFQRVTFCQVPGIIFFYGENSHFTREIWHG